MEPLKGGKIPLEVLIRGKDAEQNEKLFEKITDVIKSAGNKVGVLPKDNSSGPFVEEWKKTYGDISKSVDEVDISPAISSAALAVKDENELVCLYMYLNFMSLTIYSVQCEMLRRPASL